MTLTFQPQPGIHVSSMQLILPGNAVEIPIQAAMSQFEPGDQRNLTAMTKKTTTIFSGVIDTGATATCISNRIVEKLDLITIGVRKVGTANGLAEHTAHIINFALQNNIIFPALDVTAGDIGDTDFVLGMDILNRCHLSIQRLYDSLFIELKVIIPLLHTQAPTPTIHPPAAPQQDNIA